MKTTHVAALLALTTAPAFAGGIDRSGQPIDIIFRDGNYVEFGYAYTNPEASGNDISGSVVSPFTGPIETNEHYDDVGKSFASFSGGIKFQVNDKLSFALTGAEDFGADVRYEDVDGSNIGGTRAIADTYTLNLIGRIKLNENWSIHAGPRIQQASGDIRLDGNAYGGATFQDGAGNLLPAATVAAATGGALSGNTASGYTLELKDDVAVGYMIGGAFEIPQYAVRVAATYFSPITHSFTTTETFDTRLPPSAGATPAGSVSPSSSKTDLELPQAINLEAQTGIAKDTLLFGSVRWADWTAFEIAPDNFSEATGTTLVTLDEDTFTYRLGVARRLNENWALSGAFAYEAPGDRLKSPLSPTTGFQQVELGARYNRNKIEISTGVRYRWLGDAFPETGTPDVARADFDGNTALTAGVRIGVYF